MKKPVKLLSIVLCFAMAISMFAFVTTSAEEAAEIPVNLIQHPEFALNDEGVLSGWAFDTNTGATYTVETNDDGYNTVVIDSTKNSGMFNLGTTEITNLSPDKYYKFSVWMKMDENSVGTYGYADWGSTSVILKEKSSTRYRIAEVDPTAALKGVWKEYSIIISGEGFYTEADGYTEVSLYSSATNCKFYLRYPSIVEYDPDVAEEVATIETANLIANGDFSQYDGTVDATTTNRFSGFHVASKGTYALNHEQVTADLNGTQTTAAKITYQKQSANIAQHAYFTPSIDRTKSYRFSAWVMLTNADVKNSETGAWEEGTTYTYDGNVTLKVAKQNGNASQSVKLTNTKGVWQYVSMTITADWLSDAWADANDIRLGVGIYACALNVYIADVQLVEYVGDITCTNAENIVANGDFETYDADANSFDGWKYFNGNSSQNLMGSGAGVSGNAFLFSSAHTNGCPTATKTVSIDPTLDYAASVMVKVDDSSITGNFGYAAWGGGIRMAIKDSTATVSVKTEALSAKTDGWVKLSVDIADIPSNVTSLTITLAIGATKADVYFDDVVIEPVMGGSISANRANANAGDAVYVTVAPDWGKKLAENGLTYLATDATDSVAITEHKSDVYTTVAGADGIERKVYTSVASDNPNIYQFIMPENVDVVISAAFEDIELIAGDADWNGDVNILDLIRVKKYIAGVEVQIKAENAALETEVEGIDGNDLIELRKILLGL